MNKVASVYFSKMRELAAAKNLLRDVAENRLGELSRQTVTQAKVQGLEFSSSDKGPKSAPDRNFDGWGRTLALKDNSDFGLYYFWGFWGDFGPGLLVFAYAPKNWGPASIAAQVTDSKYVNYLLASINLPKQGSDDPPKQGSDGSDASDLSAFEPSALLTQIPSWLDTFKKNFVDTISLTPSPPATKQKNIKKPTK